MTDLPLESPDPHFATKLSSVSTSEELEAFRAELWAKRRPTLGEKHAMAVRADEIKKRGL